jgi:hypothetical protein
MRTASTRSRRLPPRKPGASTLAGARPEPRARWPAGAVAARAHRRSRTSTRPSIASFRVLLRAACASTASADRCFNEHCPGPPEHPGPRSRGRDDCLSDRSSPFDHPTAAEGTRGQGPRITESSALPPGIAPARDFAPTPIASDTSRRGHCVSPGLEAARVTGKAAGAAPR